MSSVNVHRDTDSCVVVTNGHVSIGSAVQHSLLAADWIPLHMHQSALHCNAAYQTQCAIGITYQNNCRRLTALTL